MFPRLIFVTFAFALTALSSVARADDTCTTIETFVESQSNRFPDLIVNKLPDLKAGLLIAFISKTSPKVAASDTAVVGSFSFGGKEWVGIAVFKNDCMVYIEAVSSKDWAIVNPIIFGAKI